MFHWLDYLKDLFIVETVKRQSRSQPIRRRKLRGIDYFPGKKKDPGPQFHDRYVEQFEQDPGLREFDENVKEIAKRVKDALHMNYD